jgi:hypothetical protein
MYLFTIGRNTAGYLNSRERVQYDAGVAQLPQVIHKWFLQSKEALLPQ